MHRRISIAIILLFVAWGTLESVYAAETAPRISDREIIERLTTLEEGQKRLEDKIQVNTEAIARLENKLDQFREETKTEMQQLREDMKTEMQQLREETKTETQQLREDMKTETQQLREDMRTEMQQLRDDMKTEMQQLRDDMNARFVQIDAQFNRMFQLTLGILGAFAAIVAATIGFALWDRRTMVRPFEGKVKEIEEELSNNRQRLHALLEALRSLGQTDEKVAEVLKQFQLL